jgi:hypothetical protein
MPRQKPPMICIPDTNTLIRLASIEILRRGAHLWLWDEFEVKVGNEIPHEARYLGQIKGKLNQSIIQLPYELAKMETIFLGLLGLYVDPTNKNLGERKNCQVALQLVTQKLACQVIFITDEIRIVETGFLKDVFKSYPIGHIWNSLDFILYLYLKHKRFDYETAKLIIRDVNSWIRGTDDLMQKRLKDYLERLNYIDTARRKLPELWN